VQGVWVLEVQGEQGWLAGVLQGLHRDREELGLVLMGLEVGTTNNHNDWFSLLCFSVRHQDVCLPLHGVVPTRLVCL